MKRLYVIIALLVSLVAQGQNRVEIRIKDLKSRKNLSGVNVIVDVNQVYTTGRDGRLSFTISNGVHVISLERRGYKPQTNQIKVNSDTVLVFYMLPLKIAIQPVVVKGAFFNQTNDRVNINLRIAEHLPSLTGEVDLLKVAQFLPGILPGEEGSVGLYIRGGDNYQNLYLIDGIPVYNISHVFNYLSSINSLVVKEFSIYKGGFPGYYSGRASAIVDIKLKDPNRQKWVKQGYLGVLNANMFVNVPVNKHLAFWVGTRMTYFDKLGEAGLWVYNQFMGKVNKEPAPYFNVGFYDFNTKWSWYIDRSTRLDLNIFLTKDRYAVGSQSAINGYFTKNATFEGWGTELYSLRFRKSMGNFKLDYILGYQDYKYGEGEFGKVRKDGRILDYSYTEHNMENTDFTNKILLSYIKGHSVITFHAEDIYHIFRPNNDVFDSIEYSSEVFKFHELSGSITYEYQRGKFHLMSALNNSFFLDDSISYFSLNPRLSIAYELGDHQQVRFSFDRTSQFFYGVNNYLIGISYEQDIPVTGNSAYLHNYQFSVEYSYTGKGYSVSLGGYYKQMRNLATMSDYFLDNTIPVSERLYYHGWGFSYGLELFVQKTRGRLTGQLAYTYSRSFRRFAQVNNGTLYPFRYDRPHSLNLAVDYKISGKWNLNFLWTFLSGYNVTMPVGRYILYYRAAPGIFWYGYYYTNRYNFRLPPYHRLDWVFNYRFKSKKRKIFYTLKFGLYNTYMRLNVNYLTILPDDLDAYYNHPFDKLYRMRFYKYTLLPIMPIIGLKVDFK